MGLSGDEYEEEERERARLDERERARREHEQRTRHEHEQREIAEKKLLSKKKVDRTKHSPTRAGPAKFKDSATHHEQVTEDSSGMKTIKKSETP